MPVLSDTLVQADRVQIFWTTAPGVQERCVVRFDHGGTPDSVIVTTDVQGRLQFTDDAVAPGVNYRYQLLWDDAGTLRPAAPVVVTTPIPLALGRPAPNPAGDSFRINLTMPGPGTLEVIDVTGRIRVSRSMPQGVAALDVDTHALESGVYFLRVRSGSFDRMSRIAILR